MNGLYRYTDETTAEFLHRIYNDLGCSDLAVSVSQTYCNEIHWSRRYRYDALMEMRPDAWVAGSFNILENRPMTRREFINAATHRTILDIEVMIDIDAENNDFIEIEDIKEKAKFVVYMLRKSGIEPIVYFTNNKSYHISYLDLRLRSMDALQRKSYKEAILTRYFADLQLASGKSTIALEGAIHYKSGIVKERVIW